MIGSIIIALGIMLLIKGNSAGVVLIVIGFWIALWFDVPLIADAIRDVKKCDEGD